MGLIPVLAIHLTVEIDDPFVFLPTQNILSYSSEGKKPNKPAAEVALNFHRRGWKNGGGGIVCEVSELSDSFAGCQGTTGSS